VEQFGMLNPQMQQLVVGVGGGVMLLLQVTGLVVMWLQRRKVRNLDGRVAHLSAAMALLTDTLEGGLHDVAREVSRLAAQPSSASASAAAVAVPRNRATTQRRVRGAAKRGHSVRDIAAAEQMSEGEVRLMLQNASREVKEPSVHASMR
jgi:predicted lipid-binding transport protein (Tim44 family)